MIKGIVFDCDGVLFQSQPANLAYYNHIFTKLQTAPVKEDTPEAAICHTAASPEVFRQLLGDELAVDALNIAREVDYKQFIPLMVPEDEMSNSLAELSQRLPLAIATNRGRSMDDVLDHFCLAEYFSEVVTSKDVERPKPAPDMLHRAAELMDVEPTSMIFVGDSMLDYMAAKEAEMPFVAFRWDAVGSIRVDGFTELVGKLLK